MTVIARDDVTLAMVTDVASTAHYFQLKASTASAPTAPTVYPAPSPWVTTEPTYTEGATNSLYTVDVTVFSDGSFDYTPVSLSSSYEAAKAAYNKAQQAQSTATTARTTADQAIFAALPSLADMTQANSWLCAIFPTGTGSVQTLPSYSLIASLAASDTKYSADSGYILSGGLLDYHYGLIRTLVSFSADTTWTFTYSHDDGSRIYVDGVIVFENAYYAQNDSVTINFTKGNHIVDIMYSNGLGSYGVWGFSVALSSIATTMYAPAGASVLASALATTQKAAVDAQSAAASASSVATQANATAVSANQSATSAQTAANLALANAQELVVNGGFETGDLTGWTMTPSSNGKTIYIGTWFDGESNGPNGGKYRAINYEIQQKPYSFITSTAFHVIPGRTLRASMKISVWDLNVTRTAQLSIVFDDSDPIVVVPYTLPAQARVTAVQYGDIVVPNGVSKAQVIVTTGAAQTRFDDVSVKDITEAQAAQKAADDAQSTADTANITAQNATAIANAAKAAAQGAQTTADGKNRIFSSASEPSHTGIVPGDMWFQLDSNKNVSGIQVWNGSAFTDMVLLANELLVASSVGTTQIADNAITTGKITANAVTAIKIAAQTITGDKLDVGSVAAAIVTSGKFQTAASGARVVMDSNGISAYDSSNALTFQINASNGNVTSNGGTFTGSTFRTNDGSDRTEMNNTGVTVYKGSTAYAHMGSDTAYGLSLWDPVSKTMSDASSMMFGTVYYQSEAYLSTKIFTTTGDTPWFFDDANTAIITPTGRIAVSFSFGNDYTTDNNWSTLVMGQIFVTSSPHGQHSQDDWQIQSNGWVGETRELRTGPGNNGLLPASRTEIISGLPKNVPLYPCLGIRGHGIVNNGTRWSISVRLRTIVAHPC